MPHLLHPAALWTLGALALPLALHLWRPPPRTVRLGSLRFLENGPRRPLRNLRWRELLLLCTRLGLLGVLAVLLADPRWLVPPPAGARRWALLDPTAAPAGDTRARWDDLRKSGYELRRLAPGFPTAPADPSPDTDPAAAPDLWSLLREADAELPAGSTLAVFSPGRQAALRGTRPALGHCKIEWVQTPDAAGDDPHAWITSAHLNGDAAHPRVVVGRSDARSTSFIAGELRDPLVFPAHGDESWQLEVRPGNDPGALAVRVLGRARQPADQPGPWTPGTPAPAAPGVLILHDAEHAADARYVGAAVRAASEAAGRPVNLQDRDLTPDAENAPATDWTFWLSTRPVPAGLLARAPRLVRYAGGDPVTAAGWIVAPTGDEADGVRLWKRAALTPGPGGTRWWSDGQGNPTLTYSRPAAGERWDLYTRLDPDWTDLPRTTALPAWLRALLFPEIPAPSNADPADDRRLADPTQSRPAEAAAATPIPALAATDQPAFDLHWPLWTLAALLFAVERVLSLLRPSTPPRAATTPRPAPATAASR